MVRFVSARRCKGQKVTPKASVSFADLLMNLMNHHHLVFDCGISDVYEARRLRHTRSRAYGLPLAVNHPSLWQSRHARWQAVAASVHKAHHRELMSVTTLHAAGLTLRDSYTELGQATVYVQHG